MRTCGLGQELFSVALYCNVTLEDQRAFHFKCIDGRGGGWLRRDLRVASDT